MSGLPQLGNELVTKRRELLTLFSAIKNGAGEYVASEDQLKRVDELQIEIGDLQAKFDSAKKLSDLESATAEDLKAWQAPAGERHFQGDDGDGVKAFEIPRNVARYAPVKNFRDIPGGWTKEQQAYAFGHWFLGAVCGREESFAKCQKLGVPLFYDADNKGNTKTAATKAMSTIVNTLGGAYVPDEFSSTIIDLREQYGVFRRNAGIEPMSSDTKLIPRETGGPTVYFVGEGTAPTASDIATDNISLVAKKLAAITVYSSELSEDAVVNIGDRIAQRVAWAMANKEDECGFNGDGTSTYGGITGIRQKLRDVDGTIANIKSLYVGTGNAYSELVVGDFLGAVGLLPQYADTPGARWFMHRTFYYQVALREALEAGGVTKEEIVNGQRTPIYLGYPVEFAQVMPKVEGNSQVCAILGDISLGAKFGDRRSMTMALSSEYKFSEDQLAIKTTERFDINVHDVGNTTDAGPIVALITAAS